MRGAWIAIVLTACSSPSGLRIDVPLESGRAELLLPTTPCGDACTGLGPEFAGHMIPGSVTFLDSPTRLVAERDADGAAHFEIDPPADLPQLFVIGFDDRDQPTGLAELDDLIVRSGDAEHDRVVLDPATFAPNTPNGDEDLFYVWRQPTGDPTHASCLGVQHADGSAEFYVPDDDPDCDAITGAAECNAYYYLFANAPDANMFCLDATPAPGIDACEIGRPVSCADVLGGPGCAGLPLHPTCVPQAACNDCGTMYTTACLDSVRMDPTVTYIECKLSAAVVTIGTGSFDTPCTSNSGDTTFFTDLDPYFTGADCKGAGFIATSMLVPGAIQATQSFALNPVSGASSNAMLGVDAPQSKCALQLGWSGQIARPSNVPQVLGGGVVVIRSASGNDLAIPFKPILVEDGCMTGMTCRLLPNPNTDTIWSCAQ